MGFLGQIPMAFKDAQGQLTMPTVAAVDKGPPPQIKAMQEAIRGAGIEKPASRPEGQE